MKRLISVMLAIIFIVTALPLPAVAGSATAVSGATSVDGGTVCEGISWSLDTDGVLSVNGTGEIPGYEAVNTDVPNPAAKLFAQFFGGISGEAAEVGITSMAPWGKYNTQIKEIRISEGITSIGDYAFVGSYAEKISLPETLTHIGGVSFGMCPCLEELAIPGNVNSIDYLAFIACIALKKLKFCEGG